MASTAMVTTAQIQVWIALIGGLATAILGLLKYFNIKGRRERLGLVGEAFRTTVDALSSDDPARRFAGAILLRRFFDRKTEQGGRTAPYAKEARDVIAALLREASPGDFQKLLADGLLYAPSLERADLQGCHLEDAYLGQRPHRIPNLSSADLFRAHLDRASLKGAVARGTVFYGAVLRNTVLVGCDLTAANFSDAQLEGANFGQAIVSGASFRGAKNIPAEVSKLLDAKGQVAPATTAQGLDRLIRYLRRQSLVISDTRVGEEE
jgi:uncharacterized protein YjbI with pentapeptide repeats